MNKTYKYTFLTLFLAFVFAIGSMAAMNLILRIRERQLLTESGRVVSEAPVRAWQEQESIEEGEKDVKSAMESYSLTIRQMEEVISYWKEHTGVNLHNPVKGQISMEEAMKAGEEWLTEMEMEENGQDKDAGISSINATLGVAAQNVSGGELLEPYYSFWIVQVYSQPMRAVLYLNAVTGKVWGAEITLYENFPEEIPYEKVKRFAELSGLQISDMQVERNQEGTQAILQADDNPLYAKMELEHRNSKIGYPYISNYDEKGLVEYSGETLYKENVTMIFKLAVN